MAFGEHAQGIGSDRLRYSVCSPGIETGDGCRGACEIYPAIIVLDDRPGAPLRFSRGAEPDQVINHAMDEWMKTICETC